VLLNYHIGRFVLGSLCVGDLVWLSLSGVRVAGFSLKHGHHSKPSFSLQHGHHSNPSFSLQHGHHSNPSFSLQHGHHSNPSFSLQHGHHSNPATPNLQHTSNQEQNDQCDNSTTQSQAPDDGYINIRNMLST